jgi:aspartyl-tRNA(Asn)/glutamyl-tRNA(Gln) amidotransferase subunit C
MSKERQKIDRAQVEHVANLARLRFEEDELMRFTSQLNQILQYMEQLNELDTKEVPPTYHAIELTNVMREDEVRDSIGVQATVSNAPQQRGGAFVVPKVID